jgi:hypothetical protein
MNIDGGRLKNPKKGAGLSFIFIAFFLLFRNAAFGQDELQPMKLRNLYGLSIAVNFDNYQDKDILSYYPADYTTLPDGSTFMGGSLRFRYHITDWFYGGLGWDWLSKAFEINDTYAHITQTYTWSAWNPYANLGLVFFRGINSFLYLEAGAGRVILHDSTYAETGGAGDTGNYSGGAVSGSLGLGGTWFLIPLVSAEIYGGYRLAKLDDSSVDAKYTSGDPIQASGQKPFIDFSGPVIRLGLSIYLGMPDPFADLSAPPAKTIAPETAQPLSTTAQPAAVSPSVTP